ncbi:MAG TPA: hypothetical protein PKN21_05535 [Bacteroidales bacterium]|nr:hypothetical protein [Bacteroidales bacterium]
MDEQQPPVTENPSPNLVFLKILCVMTFIGSGLGFISYGIIGLNPQYFLSNLSLAPDEESRELIAMLLSTGRTFLLLNALFYGISFAGALLLWKLRKVGFHLYTASQLLLLILPMAFIKGFPMPGTSIFMTLIFIWGYSGFLKFMK